MLRPDYSTFERARSSALSAREGGRGLLAGLFAVLAVLATVGTALSQRNDPYAVRTDWESYFDGSLNISLFVFRDVSRDGEYSLGDRPMSGILVDLVGNGRTVSARTNLSGFANFRMSASRPSHEVTFPGDYDFSARPPADWVVTTGNPTQHTTFELRPGAPADLIAKPAPLPVGLAPPLRIEGGAAPGEAIAVTSPDGTAIEVVADQAGRFAIEDAMRGTWHVRPESAPAARRVAVVATPVLLSAAGEGRQGCGSAIETVSFDDLISQGILKIPSGYHRLRWSNFVATHQKFYGSDGYRNNAISGEFLAYNGSGHPVSIASDAPFDLVGGYFGTSTLAAEGETLIVRAWRGDEPAYEDRFPLSAMGARYFAADYNCVTRVDFETLHYWQFTVDDLDVRLPR